MLSVQVTSVFDELFIAGQVRNKPVCNSACFLVQRDTTKHRIRVYVDRVTYTYIHTNPIIDFTSTVPIGPFFTVSLSNFCQMGTNNKKKKGKRKKREEKRKEN